MTQVKVVIVAVIVNNNKLALSLGTALGHVDGVKTRVVTYVRTLTSTRLKFA